MFDIGKAASILGLVLLVGGTFTTAYFLLFSSVDVTRVITFAGILIFSASFLLLFERVTLVELPGSLGKITVQAREDAAEIGDIRQKVEAQSEAVERSAASVAATAEKVSALTQAMEAQQRTVTGIVDDLNATAEQVSALSSDTRHDFAALREARLEDRRRYLREQIDELGRQSNDLTMKLAKSPAPEEYTEIFKEQYRVNQQASRLQSELEAISEPQTDTPGTQPPDERTTDQYKRDV